MFSGEDVYRPSYFEMVAADRLVGGLKPAIKHIAAVLSRRHPAFHSLVRYSDEVFFALLYALERHYLRAHDGSFAEYFYGLKRVALQAPLQPHLAAQVARPEQYSAALFGADAVSSASNAAKPPGVGGGSGASAAAAAVSSAGLGPGRTAFFRPLDESDRRRALFFLVALPWAKGRLDGLFVRWRDGVNDEGFEEAPFDEAAAAAHTPAYAALRRLFMHVYPLAHLAYEGGQLVAQLRFLFEASVFYSPWLYAQAQVVRRMNMEEMTNPVTTATAAAAASAAASAAAAVAPAAGAALERAWPTAPHLRLLHALRRMLVGSAAWVGRYAKYGVLLSIFAFKFLEWWYSPANAYYAAGGGGGGGGIGGGRKLPRPPPPQPAPRAPGGLLPPSNPRLCALCGDARTNPAALPSGYVFCYACVHQHLQAHHTCPVTLRPCEVEQIRKIYEG